MVLQADADHIPLQNESQDLVFCSHVLYFVSDLDQCVLEIARVLKPGGNLVANIGHIGLRAQIAALFHESGAGIVFHKRLLLTIMTRILPMVIQGKLFHLPKGQHRVAALSEQRYRTAFEHAGLVTKPLDAGFMVSRAGMVESAKSRWLSGLGPCISILASWVMERLIVGSHNPNDDVALNEPLLIGRKPLLKETSGRRTRDKV